MTKNFNFTPSNAKSKIKFMRIHFACDPLISNFLYKIIIFYIKGVCIAFKCKKATDTSNVQFAVSKNGRNMKRGTCVICGTTKTQFFKVPKSGSL